MTRRHYVALAKALGAKRPDVKIMGEDAYTQWCVDVIAVCDALESTNPTFDRLRFQTAAFEELQCKARHPMHDMNVVCVLDLNHAGEHFNSFYMRSWGSDEHMYEGLGNVACNACGHTLYDQIHVGRSEG